MRRTDPVVFNKIYNIVNDILGLSRIDFDDSKNIVDIKVRIPDLSSSFDLSTLSEGQQQLLILLSAIKIIKSGNVYFIEEPEVHIHSGAQKRLLKVMLDECSESQFFIT